MVSYEHAQITRAIEQLDKPPSKDHEYSLWARAEGHLRLLRQNVADSEVILYACSKTSFISAVMTMVSDVTPPDQDDLLDWNPTVWHGRAGYVWTSETDQVWIEFQDSNPLPTTMKHQQNLIFGRRMEGVDDSDYYELLQEFVHATAIHWKEELRAYCRVDENGDVEPVVSITKPNTEGGITLVTCKREPLEQYTAATGNVLVRFFDFTMVAKENFTTWRGGIQERKTESEFLFYNQCVHPDGHAWTRGTQILSNTLPEEDLFRSITEPRWKREGRQYVSFLTHDWRNDKIEEVSTDPESTTNFFDFESNSLPLEVSPAFFRAEVLSKYKADRDKYTIHEATRYITCRGAWELKSYDINEAGQVHAYICDLRHLPYQEQLHWKSHNEKPKGSISKRAYENDIRGTWSSHITALERVLHTLQRWVEQSPDWWRIRDEALLFRVNTPVASSKDEWGQAFLDLSKVVIEGFQTRPIRALLRHENVAFDKEDRTLSLLEKLLASRNAASGGITELTGLRAAQQIRSTIHSHSGGTEADEIVRTALMEHSTYRAHFEHICNQIATELGAIEKALTALEGERTEQPRGTTGL